jgi:type II secretory pathway pseudopilin PulG
MDAFTFVEVFAALVFLAILIPAVVQGLSIANKASVVSERSGFAAELAENKMNELLTPAIAASLSGTTSSTGLGTSTGNSSLGNSSGSLTSGASNGSGDFGTDWPGYRWETNEQTWAQDTVNPMTQLSVIVYYPVQGKEQSVTLTTLVSGSGQNQTGL